MHHGQMCRSHLCPPLPRQEQVRTTLVPVCCGSIPQKLHLDPADQTGREAELLRLRTKEEPAEQR